MSYKRRTIWDRKLPAFAGIFVLLFALGLTLVLSRNTVQFVSKATVGSVPKNVQISNISPTSFTISYETDASAVGTVAYGNVQTMGDIGLDVRDQQTGTPTERRVHFITINDLKPATKYYYAITSGTQVITNGTAPFEIITAAEISSTPPPNETMSGSVALDDGTFPTEGLVYASTDSSQIFATLLQPDGRFTLPLGKLRTIDLTSYLPLANDTKVMLKISTGTLQSEATLLGEQTVEVPTIVLSKNYDFTIGPEPLNTVIASQSGQPASQSAGFPVFDEPIAVTSPEITTPEEDQKFKDSQPVFKGRALPSTPIEIVINSAKEITAQLESDANGNWEFQPPLELDPGPHTMTIASADINGTLQTLSRSFTVNAAGSQFTEPSVSPVQGSPTQAPPITPTRAQLPSPTLTPSPTATPSPTINVTPPQVASISPTRGPLGQTGSYSTAAGIITSVLFLASGVILFFTIAV
ncbi:MAG: hypothetical protein H0W89_01830 [Candidatus Levybacteria bacterium]|nr:hypothetical protein [Candidatus Levybacteria bacterium]